MKELVNEFANLIYLALCKEDRYTYLLDGLIMSLKITLIAAVIGVVLGLLLAIAKLFDNDNYIGNSVVKYIRKLVSGIANGYISIIRGTPAVVQLMIIYFVVFLGILIELPIFANLPRYWFAGIAFGLNSAAYVAEVIRAGIMAVDKGQNEAGRSLGLSSGKTMTFIIVPQAIKNVLPALGNEFIVLLKETSIAGYIGIVDLTKGAQKIGVETSMYMAAYLCAAYIYFIMTTFLSSAISAFERRLHKSD